MSRTAVVGGRRVSTWASRSGVAVLSGRGSCRTGDQGQASDRPYSAICCGCRARSAADGWSSAGCVGWWPAASRTGANPDRLDPRHLIRGPVRGSARGSGAGLWTSTPATSAQRLRLQTGQQAAAKRESAKPICSAGPAGLRDRAGARPAVEAVPPRGRGIMGSDDQAHIIPPPRHRHASSAPAVPDLPTHRGIPARPGQRGPDGALSPRPRRHAHPAGNPARLNPAIRRRNHRRALHPARRSATWPPAPYRSPRLSRLDHSLATRPCRVEHPVDPVGADRVRAMGVTQEVPAPVADDDRPGVHLGLPLVAGLAPIRDQHATSGPRWQRRVRWWWGDLDGPSTGRAQPTRALTAPPLAGRRSRAVPG